MADMTYQEALERVQKLLALAESNNVHEAAQAAARAQEVMDRFQITKLSLEESGQQKREPDEPIMDFGSKGREALLDEMESKLIEWRWRLADCIARANGCVIYQTWLDQFAKDSREGRSKKGLAIVGRPGDVETTRYLFEYCKREIDRLALKEGAGCGKTWCNNFRLGAVTEVGAMLRDEKIRLVDRMRAEAAFSTALVRIDSALQKRERRLAQVEVWTKKNCNLRSGGAVEGGRRDRSAFDAGRQAARENISVGSTSARARLGVG